MKTSLVILKLVAVLVFLALLAFEMLAQTSGNKQASRAEKTLTGVVSDSMCGATHMAKDKSPAECTRLCVQQGNKYALVVGKKVYTLEGHEAELNKLAAQKVTVKGTISGNTITVASVAPASKEKKSHIPSGN